MSLSGRETLTRVVEAFVVLLLLAYPLDWLVWRLGHTGNGGMGAVPVTETTAATLKGEHFEVLDQQTTSMVCSLSLLPQGGAKPCWWVRRHPEVVKQY